ncbi:MAG: M67 family metallopeptidase [Elusimicrobia bacterium]|nr:M67 family metallopeptidase [Elusimicrobiota bacterium]
MSLRVTQPVWQLIEGYARSAYPEECCGALIGEPPSDFDRPGRLVEATDARAFGNAWESGARGTRYQVEPSELARLERELAGTGRAIVGWYHTHPDVPAWPSPYDLLRSWPCYSYLIVSVVDRRAVDARSWMRSEDGKDFVAEPFEAV